MLISVIIQEKNPDINNEDGEQLEDEFSNLNEVNDSDSENETKSLPGRMFEILKR